MLFYQLEIKHKLGRKTTDHFKVISKLEDDDIYDVIFIVSRCSQLDTIIPIIENNKSKNVVLVGNNLNAEKYAKIKDKNVLFAFFMAAGKKYDGYINSVCLNKITIGRIDGKNTDDEFIKSIFKETKVKAIIENKMNDYLKTHGCAVLPLVFASYKVDGDLKLLKKDKEYPLLIMDAIIEGYDVLKKKVMKYFLKASMKIVLIKKKNVPLSIELCFLALQEKCVYQITL